MKLESSGTANLLVRPREKSADIDTDRRKQHQIEIICVGKQDEFCFGLVRKKSVDGENMQLVVTGNARACFETKQGRVRGEQSFTTTELEREENTWQPMHSLQWHGARECQQLSVTGAGQTPNKIKLQRRRKYQLPV